MRKILAHHLFGQTQIDNSGSRGCWSLSWPLMGEGRDTLDRLPVCRRVTAGVPGENPRMHGENMQTPQLGLEPGDSCCEYVFSRSPIKGRTKSESFLMSKHHANSTTNTVYHSVKAKQSLKRLHAPTWPCTSWLKTLELYRN
ncbi:uncharacterized protein LOC144990958 isoform X2 [Oryzias latipes]